MTTTPREEAPRASELPRRSTDRPDRFLIPAEQLPPDFAARVEQPREPPAEARPAATVALVRPGKGELEVLLLRRPSRSAFAAGAWVFPGGAVDAEDRVLDLELHAAGPDARQWAERLALDDPRDATGYVVAALREAWEETGILLARGGTGAPFCARRAELMDGPTSFGELLAREGLRLDTADLLYVAHWVTPVPEARRFDTRFFVGRVDPATECELVGTEIADAQWLPPARAVEQFEAGELRLLPPTVHTLRRLAPHRSPEELWSALADAPVPRFLPRMRNVPEGVVIEIGE